MKKLALACVLLAAAPIIALTNEAFLCNRSHQRAVARKNKGASSESTTQPTTSLPQASGTEQPTVQPGSTVGVTRTQPPAATTTAPATTR